MPRVRCSVYVFAATLIQLWFISHGQHVQNVISMTEDGWRPIIGSGREPLSFRDQTLRKSPGIEKDVKIEIAKSNAITLSSKPPSKLSGETTHTIKNEAPHINNNGRKVTPQTKSPSQDYQTIQTIPSIALSPPQKVLPRPQGVLLKKQPITAIKPVPQFLNSKRKPLRGPSASHNEPFFKASASGVFPVVEPLNSIKTRDTPLGLLGSNHFSINQPHGHIEFNRYLIPPNNDVFQQFKSQPLFLFSNPPHGDFKKQNDEYTRHLVPPPPGKQNGQSNVKFEDSIASVSQTVSKLQNGGPNQFGLRPPQLQDNLIIQTPEQGFDFQKQFKPKEHATDVQVTRENFKDFHANLPGIRVPTIPDYVDFDFHTISTPGQLPKLQTYEVTEGKWADNPNGFTFSIQNRPQKSQSQTKAPLRRPQLIKEPIVELNLPPFLPTPYKPDPAVPTSETQKEASTVFSKVTSKFNKNREEFLANSPLHFDIKEVSTHYPILGQPAFQSNSLTGLGIDNEEISNNVPTTRPTTESSGTHKPKMRRKPKPRRPITTTTEESITESSELQKLSDSAESQTEKIRKRQRTRPTYRTSTENIENLTRYKTTTVKSDSDEISTERNRGRNRYRQRGNYVSNEIPSRKRIRPNLTNHKISDTNTGLIENKDKDQDTDQTKYEDKGSAVQDSVIMRDDLRRIPEEVDVKLDTSFASNEINTGRPEFSMEETTIKNYESDESPDLTSEGVISESFIQTSAPTFDVIPTTAAVLEHVEEFATTAASTTTSEASTTTKTIRSRSKLKYNSSNRPRFSVKDYRQRLNQYTSTTPTTTTDFIKTTESVRVRFPSRLRSRPTPTSSTTTQSDISEDEENTEPILRRRFRPKEPRHSSTTTETVDRLIHSEHQDKYSNTRSRPINRKSSELKPKVSIRQNLFSVKRRPPLTMRNKNKTTEEITTTEAEELTQTPLETNVESEKVEVSEDNKLPSMEVPEADVLNIDEATTESLTEEDYSKRVSDLTSSFQNEYDSPGFFKSVPSNSRRIPNYFTISTEDPILPIEAFFPNLKDKE